MKKHFFHQFFFIVVYLFFVPFDHNAHHQLWCNNSVYAEVTSFSSTGRGHETNDSKPVISMEIGDKWCYEKRYQSNVLSVAEYTPCVFTVLDTTTINESKIFIVEKLEIPSYKKDMENWQSDSLIFTRNGELYYTKSILQDTTWSESFGVVTRSISVRVDTILGVITKIQTNSWIYGHAGETIRHLHSLAENIGIVNLYDYHSGGDHITLNITNYQLMSSPNLSSGQPLHCFILKMIKMQNNLNIVWNKGLEDNISHYRIFINNKLVDSTKSASDTSKVLKLQPDSDQLIGVAAVNAENVMSTYHNQKLTDFEKAPTAVNLISPRGQVIELSSDPTVAFKWEPATGSGDDMISYIFHIYGENCDSTITGLSTTEIQLSSRWQENVEYFWSVQASNGRLLTSSPKQSFYVYYVPPSAFNLLSPLYGQVIELSSDPTVAFKWEPATGSGDDMISYIFHIHSENYDSTITGLSTTEIQLSSRWQENVEYFWSVQASNGRLLTSSPEYTFQVFYAKFEPPRIFPNPFTTEIKIVFRLAVATKVNLTVYNCRGQKIRTLLDDIQCSGPHTTSWSGNDEAWNQVASGVYFLVLLNEDKRYVQKILLLK